MMNKLILLTLYTTGVLAAHRSPLFGIHNPLLGVRQAIDSSCEDQGLVTCGEGCIEDTWSCCPGGNGGCPPTAFCDVGDNGEYGCCPEGSTCGGDGGANTRTETAVITASAQTTTVEVSVTVPGQTDVTVQEPTNAVVPPAVVPTPNGNGTLPTPTPVVTAGGSSNAANWVGGLFIGAVALIL